MLLDLNHTIGTSLDCYANIFMMNLKPQTQNSFASFNVHITWKFQGTMSEYHTVRLVGSSRASPNGVVATLVESRLSHNNELGGSWQTTLLPFSVGGDIVSVDALQISLSAGSEQARLVIGEVRIVTSGNVDSPPPCRIIPQPLLRVFGGSSSSPCSLLKMGWQTSSGSPSRPVIVCAKQSDNTIRFLGEYDLSVQPAKAIVRN